MYQQMQKGKNLHGKALRCSCSYKVQIQIQIGLLRKYVHIASAYSGRDGAKRCEPKYGIS